MKGWRERAGSSFGEKTDTSLESKGKNVIRRVGDGSVRNNAGGIGDDIVTAAVADDIVAAAVTM